MESLEPPPLFVNDYLSFLYEAHPTAATFDGVHTHDDLLEDFARGQIERQRRDLGGFARRLAAIRAESPAPAANPRRPHSPSIARCSNPTSARACSKSSRPATSNATRSSTPIRWRR